MAEQQLLYEKTLFGKMPLEKEKLKFHEAMEFILKAYTNTAYPFILINREETVENLKKAKEKLVEVGV